jgi:hypothetical protein
MPPWTPERQAEFQRTIAMIRRSAERQATTFPELAGALVRCGGVLPPSWEAFVEAMDLRVVAAPASGLVMPIPPAEIRRGDLLVRHADDSVSPHRLIPRRHARHATA